jgi:hypothetical protein
LEEMMRDKVLKMRQKLQTHISNMYEPQAGNKKKGFPRPNIHKFPKKQK